MIGRIVVFIFHYSLLAMLSCCRFVYCEHHHVSTAPSKQPSILPSRSNVHASWISPQCQVDLMRNSYLSFENRVLCNQSNTRSVTPSRPVGFENATLDWNVNGCVSPGELPTKYACILGSTRFKFIYVYNYKVMSSTLYAILATIFRSNQHLDIRSCGEQNIHKILNMTMENFKLNDFFVFTFVRDPLDRFRSAFHYYQHEILPNPLHDPVLITQLLLQGFVVDGHFRSQSNNLVSWQDSLNSVLNYSFVGRFEYFREDWMFVAKQLMARTTGEHLITTKLMNSTHNSFPHENPTKCSGSCNNATSEALLADHRFMSNFCRISYQDYVCLGYILPQVCIEAKQKAENKDWIV